jgi:hypothetical protein
VRRDGFVRGRALRLRRATGEPVPVVVAAALLTDGESERFGFTLWPAEPAGA